jgi:hypothetical protein
MELEELKKDALEYGTALNDAGFAALDEWQKANVQINARLWNNLKVGIRAAILKYIEAHEKQGEENEREGTTAKT